MKGIVLHSSKKKAYLAPKVTVYYCKMGPTLLVNSNEGLEYEDLFTTNE